MVGTADLAKNMDYGKEGDDFYSVDDGLNFDVLCGTCNERVIVRCGMGTPLGFNLSKTLINMTCPNPVHEAPKNLSPAGIQSLWFSKCKYKISTRFTDDGKKKSVEGVAEQLTKVEQDESVKLSSAVVTIFVTAL